MTTRSSFPRAADSIAIAVVEDDRDTRSMLRQCIDDSRCLTLVAEADTYEAAAALIDSARFDVLLLDLDLQGRLSLPLIQRAAEFCKVLVITVFTDESTVLRAIALGADGYLVKSDDSGLEETILRVMHGEAPLSPSIARHLLRQLRDPSISEQEPRPQLTQREADVLDLLARGFSYQQAADQFGISHSTIAFHVRQIYDKLQVNSKSAAVFEGLQSGIIRL